MLRVRDPEINGNASNCIANWLQNRQQRMVIICQASNWTIVRSGVPLRSIPGPILFNTIIY